MRRRAMLLLVLGALGCASAPGSAAPDAGDAAAAECRGPGRYEAGKEGSYRPCCAGLTEVFYGKAGTTAAGVPVCTQPPLRVYACVRGVCGDGICEPGEAPRCGCVADCPEAAWSGVGDGGASDAGS